MCTGENRKIYKQFNIRRVASICVYTLILIDMRSQYSFSAFSQYTYLERCNFLLITWVIEIALKGYLKLNNIFPKLSKENMI